MLIWTYLPDDRQLVDNDADYEDIKGVHHPGRREWRWINYVLEWISNNLEGKAVMVEDQCRAYYGNIE